MARGSCCAGSYPLGKLKALPCSLPVIQVIVGGRKVRALVDTGCSTTVVASHLVPKSERKESSLMTVDGREIACEGERNVELAVEGTRMIVRAIVLRQLVDGIYLVLGLDAINRLGGVVIKCIEPVTFGKATKQCCQPVRNGRDQCTVTVEKRKLMKNDVASGIPDRYIVNRGVRMEPCKIDDKDFAAKFDGERWEVEWFWNGEIPVL